MPVPLIEANKTTMIRTDDYGTPFLPIPKAAALLGLPKHWLREGCKAGTVPHVMSGRKYLVNVPRFLSEQINNERGGSI